jgi:hypothetical protein
MQELEHLLQWYWPRPFTFFRQILSLQGVYQLHPKGNDVPVSTSVQKTLMATDV